METVLCILSQLCQTITSGNKLKINCDHIHQKWTHSVHDWTVWADLTPHTKIQLTDLLNMINLLSATHAHNTVTQCKFIHKRRESVRRKLVVEVSPGWQNNVKQSNVPTFVVWAFYSRTWVRVSLSGWLVFNYTVVTCSILNIIVATTSYIL